MIRYAYFIKYNRLCRTDLYFTDFKELPQGQYSYNFRSYNYIDKVYGKIQESYMSNAEYMILKNCMCYYGMVISDKELTGDELTLLVQVSQIK